MALDNLLTIPDTSFTCVCKLCRRTIQITSRPPRGMAKLEIPAPVVAMMQLAEALLKHFNTDHPEHATTLGSLGSAVVGNCLLRSVEYTGPNGAAVKRFVDNDYDQALALLAAVPSFPPVETQMQIAEEHTQAVIALGVSEADARQYTERKMPVVAEGTDATTGERQVKPGYKVTDNTDPYGGPLVS